MLFGSSLAGGFAAASLQALQPNFSFRVSAKTLVAFGLGFLVLYCYWRILFHPSVSSGQKRLRMGASALLAIIGLTGFLYPLRFIAPNNHGEVAAGLVIACLALAVVIALLLMCKRFLDADARKNEP